MMKKMLMVVATAVAVAALFLPTAEAGGRPLVAELSAENEVPPAETGATGAASLTLNQGQGEVCFDITADGLSAPAVAAHIHAGAAGVNGPVVVNLDVASNGLNGCVDGVDPGLVKAIRQSPGDYYVNVHTSTVPSGEVRGQLSK